MFVLVDSVDNRSIQNNISLPLKKGGEKEEKLQPGFGAASAEAAPPTFGHKVEAKYRKTQKHTALIIIKK